MLFFPIGTDRQLRRTPWVNYALIAANILVFLFTERSIQHIDELLFQYQSNLANDVADRQDLLALRDAQPVYQAYLQPGFPELRQFFSYQFLHADLWHLLGNMLFLFVFGNAVEDRLGRLGYLAFYLAGGVIAGAAHIYTSDAPVLGASGSVAAVTGAFLALFPLANITIGYWFIIVFDTFVVSAIVLILFRVAQDFIFNLGGIGNVAYGAHLAGYAYGFSAAMAVLLLRLLPGEPYDMLTLIERKRRRREFQKLTQDGYHPWESARPNKGQTPSKAGGTPSAAAELSPPQRELLGRRAEISKRIAAHDFPAAADTYAKLLDDHPGQVLPQQQQLDMASQLMADQRHVVSARAYELFLEKYRSYPDAPQVKLILALIYARYLDQPQRARELLTQAQPRLTGKERELADTQLAQLPQA